MSLNINNGDVVQSVEQKSMDNLLFNDAGESNSPESGNGRVVSNIPIQTNGKVDESQLIENGHQQQQHSQEEIDRGLQSKYDKAQHTINELQSKIGDAGKFQSFASNFDADENFRKALIHKYHPELFQQENPKVLIENKLKEEFGEEFEYDNAGVNDKILYTERLKELSRETKESKFDFTPLEEAARIKQENAEKQKSEYEATKQAILDKHKWGEDRFANMVKWSSKLTLENISDIFNQLEFKKESVGNDFSAGRKTPSGVNPDDSLFGTPSKSFSNIL